MQIKGFSVLAVAFRAFGSAELKNFLKELVPLNVKTFTVSSISKSQ